MDLEKAISENSGGNDEYIHLCNILLPDRRALHLFMSGQAGAQTIPLSVERVFHSQSKSVQWRTEHDVTTEAHTCTEAKTFLSR